MNENVLKRTYGILDSSLAQITSNLDLNRTEYRVQ